MPAERLGGGCSPYVTGCRCSSKRDRVSPYRRATNGVGKAMFDPLEGAGRGRTAAPDRLGRYASWYLRANAAVAVLTVLLLFATDQAARRSGGSLRATTFRLLVMFAASCMAAGSLKAVSRFKSGDPTARPLLREMAVWSAAICVLSVLESAPWEWRSLPHPYHPLGTWFFVTWGILSLAVRSACCAPAAAAPKAHR